MMQKSILFITGVMVFIAANIMQVYAQPQEIAVKGYDIGARASKTLQKDVFPYKTDVDVQGFLLGMQSGLVLQEPVLKTHQLTSDIELLRRSLNTLELNIPQFLRQQSNKRKALFDHVNLLKRIQETMLDREQIVRREIAQLQSADELNRDRIEASEDRFFENLGLLNANQAVSDFEIFVDAARKNVDVRAYLGALQKVQDFYKQLLTKIEKLILAIEKNREALVEGITVTEIEDIDLGIINRN